MKRKSIFLIFLGLLMVLALGGCGNKSQKDVVKDLNAKIQDLTGYKVKAKMTLQTGSDPQVYNVEIWHKSPIFYRVNLKNSQKEHNQMILRNKEGVFVLTPALNKSFKFQSDWPQNSSQAYLYESLVKDIAADKDATFKATKDHYIFVTKTNYQNNKMLPKQEITLNKKDLNPVSVKVMDADSNPLITVEFEKMKINASFDNDDFDMEKNMTAAQFDVPTMAETNNKALPVMYPNYEIPGVSLSEEKEVATENGKRTIMTFVGEKSYTLIEENATVFPVNGTSIPVNGEPIDLGFTVGALTDNSLKWTYQGAEFMIASDDLTKEEMVAIASSMQGQAVK